MAKYRPLGPNEICAAIEIYEGGASIEQAARAIGVGYGRLQRAFARHPDFTPRSRKHWRALYPGRWKHPSPFQRIPGPYVAAVLRHARSDEAVIQRYAEAADRLHAMRAQVRLGGPSSAGHFKSLPLMPPA